MVDNAYEIGLIDFQALETGLRSSCEEFQINSRGGAIRALQAVLKFLRSVPRLEEQSLTLPVTALLAALADLDSGQTVPMLKPAQWSNRPVDPRFRKVIRSCAICSVRALRRFGMPKTEACKFMADQLKQHEIPLGGRLNTPGWKTVEYWVGDSSKRAAEDQERHTTDALTLEFHRALADLGTIAEVTQKIERLLASMLPRLQAGVAANASARGALG